VVGWLVGCKILWTGIVSVSYKQSSKTHVCATPVFKQYKAVKVKQGILKFLSKKSRNNVIENLTA